MQQDMTRAQAQQMADVMFQRFDLNHDGDGHPRRGRAGPRLQLGGGRARRSG